MEAGKRADALTNTWARYPAERLREFSQAVLMAHGLVERHAAVTAQILVEADLLGHRTHGVDLLPLYAGRLADGSMSRAGEAEVLADTGSTLLLDGNLLPGQSLIVDAMETALERVGRHGIVAITIKRSQHTGCHAAYLADAVHQGYFVLLTAASSHGKRIAPFGGLDAAFSPSPFAVGIPTEDGPIILDMTMAATANGVCRQHYQRGERLPHEWLLDASGVPTDDPAVMYEDPKGTILPLGGLDNGHKGFGLLLMIEALTLGLSGVPHVTDPGASTRSVYLQVVAPSAFAGREAFAHAMTSVADASKAARPAPGASRPRLPGEAALEAKRRQLEEGVDVSSDVRSRLLEVAAASGVRFPSEAELA